jgi:paraquat-inducible protein B
MTRKANPTLIGLFVVGALALAVLLVVALAGGNLFQRKERAVMYFRGSIYGLQVGAPVVFRGVRLGSVVEIGLDWDQKRNTFLIPVVADIERGVVRGNRGGSQDARPSVQALVAQGLRAQLAMQSILTGQLYVDLDFRPERSADTLGAQVGAAEIPTVAAPIQDLQNQIEGLNIRKLVDDVSAIAATARQLVSGPELAQALKDAQAVAASFKRISEKLDRQVDPLAGQVRNTLLRLDTTLGRADSAMAGAGDAMRAAEAAARAAQPGLARIEPTLQRLEDAASSVATLTSPQAPLYASLQRSADELGRAAAALRQASADDGTLTLELQRALRESAQAARALRELADTLERQPESLLRGRRTER